MHPTGNQMSQTMLIRSCISTHFGTHGAGPFAYIGKVYGQNCDHGPEDKYQGVTEQSDRQLRSDNLTPGQPHTPYRYHHPPLFFEMWRQKRSKLSIVYGILTMFPPYRDTYQPTIVLTSSDPTFYVSSPQTVPILLQNCRDSHME